MARYFWLLASSCLNGWGYQEQPGRAEHSLAHRTVTHRKDISSWRSVQVLENTEGGQTGSLVACLDMCTTVMGKRQLRSWLCRPMARIADITARQDAVAELMGGAAEAAQAARASLTGTAGASPVTGCTGIVMAQRI